MPTYQKILSSTIADRYGDGDVELTSRTNGHSVYVTPDDLVELVKFALAGLDTAQCTHIIAAVGERMYSEGG